MARNGRRWWKNSAKLIHLAFPISDFDGLGVPRLAPCDLNFTNRPVRTRTPGGVAGVPRNYLGTLCRFSQ